MKTQNLLTTLVLTAAICSLALLGCKKDNHGPDIEKPFRLESNLVMDKQAFSTQLKNRKSPNAFEILEIDRQAEILEVKVKGGTDAEAFHFIWDGRVQESFPMGIQLMMIHDDEAGEFDPREEISVSVNLQSIIGDRNRVEDYHFHVINGSKVQTVVLNPDGTTTTELN
jgi:hypothetical protein